MKQQEKTGKDLKKFREVAEKLAHEKLSMQSIETIEWLEILRADRSAILSQTGFVYLKTDEEILFERTGTHADFFK
ncbi:hypothetical protein PHSC3_002069 [Chlamydiales bacterium STE3]|nr:hypothetical protein PHSC3_002069 [Chlamydiales bacterium STE3]